MSAGQDRLGSESGRDRVAATLAEGAHASAALVVAALLHDIGHLIDKKAEGAARRGVDRRHEKVGSGYLAAWFPEAVTEPVRLHVDAKRYLCATEPVYYDGLSPASKRSLALQGGPFSATEAARFIDRPHGREAVALRRWDDRAKATGAETLPLSHFRPCLMASLRDGVMAADDGPACGG